KNCSVGEYGNYRSRLKRFLHDVHFETPFHHSSTRGSFRAIFNVFATFSSANTHCGRWNKVQKQEMP
ncbi:MAG: hypothetical protein ABI876_07130, partial [Bacteroidota bacterium]